MERIQDIEHGSEHKSKEQERGGRREKHNWHLSWTNSYLWRAVSAIKANQRKTFANISLCSRASLLFELALYECKGRHTTVALVREDK